MRRLSSGYTIIEVMIFLGISAAMLATAMNLISGKQAQTDFDQTVRNTSSKLQDWINDVSTGFTGGDPTKLGCVVSGGHPQLTNSGPSASPDCVFLGKAIQFTATSDGGGAVDQADKLYAYSVFGCRLTGCTSGGQLPTNLADSTPVAATGQDNTGQDLTELFSLDPVKVTSVHSTAVGSSYNTSHLIGFFNSFNTEQSTKANGSEDINTYQFRFDGSSYTPGNQAGGDTLRQCLTLAAFPCKASGGLGNDQWPERLQQFWFCLSDNKHTAKITITSNDGLGASVDFDYESC